MSDIGILTGPFDLALIALMLFGPGFALGGLIGAIAWRRHRVAGGLIGAVAGLALWVLGFFLLRDAL